jgi:hypothetical protein
MLNDFEGWLLEAESQEKERVPMSGYPDESRMLIIGNHMVSLSFPPACLSLFLSSLLVGFSFCLLFEAKRRVSGSGGC